MWECAYVQYCTVHNTHRIWCCIYAAAHKHTKFNGGEQNILHDSCCVGQIEGCGWRRQTTTVQTEGTVAVAIYIERTPRASARWFKNENGQIFGHLECGDDEPAMRDRDCRSIHADAPWRYQGCRHIRWRVHLSGFWHSAPQQLQCEGNQNYRFPSTVVYGDNKSPKYTTRATSFILHSCTAILFRIVPMHISVSLSWKCNPQAREWTMMMKMKYLVIISSMQAKVGSDDVLCVWGRAKRPTFHGENCQSTCSARHARRPSTKQWLQQTSL